MSSQYATRGSVLLFLSSSTEHNRLKSYRHFEEELYFNTTSMALTDLLTTTNKKKKLFITISTIIYINTFTAWSPESSHHLHHAVSVVSVLAVIPSFMYNVFVG